MTDLSFVPGPLLRIIILERIKPPENLLEFADANLCRLESVLSVPENKFVAGENFSLGVSVLRVLLLEVFLEVLEP